MTDRTILLKNDRTMRISEGRKQKKRKVTHPAYIYGGTLITMSKMGGLENQLSTTLNQQLHRRSCPEEDKVGRL